MKLSRIMIGVGVASTLALIGAIVYGYAAKPGWTGVANKTLWDWLDLLIIPFVLAVGGTVGGYLFTRSESRTAQAIAERRAQDQALQEYLNKMSDLLLDDKHPLRESKEDDEVRKVARARTMTALKGLDAEHNSSVFAFLRDSDLIGETEDPIILFGLANLRNVDLRGIFLALVDLRERQPSGGSPTGFGFRRHQARSRKPKEGGSEGSGAQLHETIRCHPRRG